MAPKACKQHTMHTFSAIALYINWNTVMKLINSPEKVLFYYCFRRIGMLYIFLFYSFQDCIFSSKELWLLTAAPFQKLR